MIFYAVMKNQKLLSITDSKVYASEMAEKEMGTVLETDKVFLSAGAKCDIAMDYEADCVKESVYTALREKGVNEDADPARFEELASSIAADAHRSMIKYDTDEEYSISEAMSEHATEISALLAKS